MAEKNKKYAGFLLRLVAFFIDYLVIFIGTFIIGFLLGIVLSIQGMEAEAIKGIANLVGVAAVWVYFAAMESSPRQATLGKMAIGLYVTDLKGKRIDFWRATGRYFGKIISGMILFIGFFMVGFTLKKQALHDMLAGCLVLKK